MVQSQGRVQIPKGVREALKIREGTVLELSVEGKRIVLELVLP
jgi:AbrB family looped-hinge helix DNA binding protein